MGEIWSSKQPKIEYNDGQQEKMGIKERRHSIEMVLWNLFDAAGKGANEAVVTRNPFQGGREAIRVG